MKKTKDIKWNGETLTDKQLEENFEHIRDFNVNSIGGGYLCSTCDPFLFLVCQLFQVDINHNYRGYMMRYRITNPIKTLNFESNSGHFRCLLKLYKYLLKYLKLIFIYYNVFSKWKLYRTCCEKFSSSSKLYGVGEAPKIVPIPIEEAKNCTEDKVKSLEIGASIHKAIERILDLILNLD